MSYESTLFPFTKPLDSYLFAKYDEQMALLILQHCYPGTYSSLCLSDAPDLQDIDKSIGIEVTRMISQSEAQIEGEYTKYCFGKKGETETQLCRQKIEKNGGKVNEYSVTFPTKTSKDEKNDLQNAIRSKMAKLDDYRKSGFRSLGLFVLYEQPLIPIGLDELKSWFDDAISQYEVQYDSIFLSYSCCLICYTPADKQLYPNPIDRYILDSLCKEARIKVELSN